jgi:hypothetical protein
MSSKKVWTFEEAETWWSGLHWHLFQAQMHLQMSHGTRKPGLQNTHMRQEWTVDWQRGTLHQEDL